MAACMPPLLLTRRLVIDNMLTAGAICMSLRMPRA